MIYFLPFYISLFVSSEFQESNAFNFFSAFIGQPNWFTLKIYFNGRLQSTGEAQGIQRGSFGYFDFVDLDKLGMIELWGFVEDLGFKDKESIKFGHKIRGTVKEGRYLETELDVGCQKLYSGKLRG